jgi:hypothetical protein
LINEAIRFNIVLSAEVLPLKAKLKHLFNPSSIGCLKIQISKLQSDIESHKSTSTDSIDELNAELDIYTKLLKTEGCDCEPFDIDGYVYTQCPCEYQLKDLPLLLDLADQLEKGNLPHSGGVLEQLGTLYETVSMVSTYKNIYQSYEKK